MKKRISQWAYLLEEKIDDNDRYAGKEIFSMVTESEKTEYYTLRKDAKIRQGVAAEELGIGQSCLSQIESGRKEPDEKLKRKILDYYAAGMFLDESEDIEAPEFEYNEEIRVKDGHGEWIQRYFKLFDDNSNLPYVCADTLGTAEYLICYEDAKKMIRKVTMEELIKLVGEPFVIEEE